MPPSGRAPTRPRINNDTVTRMRKAIRAKGYEAVLCDVELDPTELFASFVLPC